MVEGVLQAILHNNGEIGCFKIGNRTQPSQHACMQQAETVPLIKTIPSDWNDSCKTEHYLPATLRGGLQYLPADFVTGTISAGGFCSANTIRQSH